MIIDAHAHLWLKQDTVVDDLPIRTLEDWDAGKSSPPPYVAKLIIEKLQSMKERD